MKCQQTRLCEVSTDPSGRQTPQAIGRHTPHSLARSLRLRKRYYLTRVWATTARVWQQLRLEWTEGDLSATPRHCAYACHVSGLSGPEEICLPSEALCICVSCRGTGPQGIIFSQICQLISFTEQLTKCAPISMAQVHTFAKKGFLEGQWHDMTHICIMPRRGEQISSGPLKPET